MIPAPIGGGVCRRDYGWWAEGMEDRRPRQAIAYAYHNHAITQELEAGQEASTDLGFDHPRRDVPVRLGIPWSAFSSAYPIRFRD